MMIDKALARNRFKLSWGAVPTVFVPMVKNLKVAVKENKVA